MNGEYIKKKTGRGNGSFFRAAGKREETFSIKKIPELLAVISIYKWGNRLREGKLVA